MNIRKIITMIIPLLLIGIGLAAVIAKLTTTQPEDPVLKLKKELIRPALEKTAQINRVMFKKHNQSRYKNNITTSVLNNTVLLIEMQADVSSSDSEIQELKNSALIHFKKYICRVEDFKNLFIVQNSIKAKYGKAVEPKVEINEIDSKKNVLWETVILPVDCL